MADEMVLRAQRWINSYNVEGIPKVEENGKTGWSVMFALTRILQFHLNISPLSDSFGPGTMAALQANYPNIDNRNIIAGINRVIQSGLYCKGYDGGGIDGLYNERVADSIAEIKGDMGVASVYPGGGTTPKVFKALLTMDPYVTVLNGDEETRRIQQWMNARYVHRRDFQIIPCDGHFSRNVQKALMLAIQFELGLSDDQATGTFGTKTKDGLRAHEIAEGSWGTWVELYSAAMRFNRRNVSFTASFDGALASETRLFQSFSALPISGRGDFATWASLLVSTGDSSRKGTACDCITEITGARAQALKAAGYSVVGRYLCNVPGGTLDKVIKPGEPQTIANHGLRLFPIYQANGRSASDYTRSSGYTQALSAIDWARTHGFRAGTRIYFAVDFDALDYEVTDNVLPYFKTVRDIFTLHAPHYEVGIYGPRNVCSRVGATGYTSASFVSDMSTGYSGNLGYPLPQDWAFDQISTVWVGQDAGRIQIDNNISSGRDAGQQSFDPPVVSVGADVTVPTDLIPELCSDVRSYLEGIGIFETGSPENGWTRLRSTTESLNLLNAHDELITRLAKSLRMRKALIQAPLFWEIRMYDRDERIAIELVEDHWAGSGISNKDDCSVGLGQIFARTAIRARNHCLTTGVIGGAMLGEDDVWPVWQRLYGDESYNVSTVPLVLIEAANAVGLTRPSWDQSYPDARATIGRYNGTGDHAEQYATDVGGLYLAFEQFNKWLRESWT